jgi:MerR family transcriptional regulator, copper efflux regulator
MSQERMQISELAEKAGVSNRTIYYYEQLGLIQPADRQGTGYRYYDDLSLRRLRIIAVLKKLGLSLEEIGQVIDFYFDDTSGIKGKQQVVAILEKHLAEVEQRFVELQRLRDDLIANIARIKAFIEIAKKG